MYNDEDYDDELELKLWLSKNDIPSEAAHLVRDIPNQISKEGSFYIKNSGCFGDKHYVSFDKEKKLIEWLKLTDELFL